MPDVRYFLEVINGFLTHCYDSEWFYVEKKRAPFLSAGKSSAKMVFSLVENARVRLSLSSWSVVSSFLSNHLVQWWASASLGSWLRVYLTSSCSGAGSNFQCTEAASSIRHGWGAPLRRSLVNIQKRTCRSIANSWSSAGFLVSQLLKVCRMLWVSLLTLQLFLSFAPCLSHI